MYYPDIMGAFLLLILEASFLHILQSFVPKDWLPSCHVLVYVYSYCEVN